MPPCETELDARAAVERLRGTPFTDEEWAAARRNLRAFAVIVDRWAKAVSPNVKPLIPLDIPEGSE